MRRDTMNRFKYLQVVAGIMLLTLIPLYAGAQTSYTIQKSVDMRNGPGSYYDLVLRLNKGATITKLDDEGTWMKVSIDDKTGWIPEQTVYLGDGEEKEQTKKEDESSSVSSRLDDAFSELSGDSSEEESPYASPAEVAAAVKGFARKFNSKRSSKTKVDLTRDFDNRINPRDYRQFRRERMTNWSWQLAQSRFPIRTDTIPSMTPEIEKMGWGIAQAIAQQGLVQDYKLQEYLNYVALIVTESSHRYETPVQVHILDDDKVVGYAAPNGIIFISKGAIQIMESEAEFAFFVGHELAHVVMQHGVKETRDRKVKIDSDDAFSELNKDLDYENRDDKYAKTAKDLAEWADQVYEYVTSKKLERYEHEADFWGMVYAYRAGYNPQAAVNLLQRIYNKQGDFKSKIGELDWQGASIKDRINNCRSHLQYMNIARDMNRDYAAAFKNMKRRL
jgi:hypothetical protein